MYIYIYIHTQTYILLSAVASFGVFVLVLSAVSWMCLNEFKMRLSMVLFNVIHTAAIDFDYVTI